MAITTFNDLAEAAAKVLGKLDTLNPQADPYPWFCKDINRKKDIQWAGYYGPIFDESNGLVFGFNLEFTSSWKRIFPKLCRETETFADMLKAIPGYEWHWWGRSAVIGRNPRVRFLSKPIPVEQVDVNLWITELEDILERRTGWSTTIAMRPQIQIVQQVAISNQATTSSYLCSVIQNIILELKPIALFLEK
jgi:hypothetical protein